MGASPGLPCLEAGYSTVDCGKEKSSKLKKDKAVKKSCWKCCIYHEMAVRMRWPHPLAGREQVLVLGEAHSVAVHHLFRTGSCWWPRQICYFFLHSGGLVNFSD